MARNRIVVGSFADGSDARATAHRLRDAGHEVVLVGGGQSPEQLLRTAVAEDASRIVVVGDGHEAGAALARLRTLTEELGVDAPEVGTSM